MALSEAPAIILNYALVKNQSAPDVRSEIALPAGLEAGKDEYPIYPLLRNAESYIQYNSAEKEIFVNGAPYCSLTPTEDNFVRVLFDHPLEVVEYDDLERVLHQSDFILPVGSRAYNYSKVTLSRIRKKFNDLGIDDIFKITRGSGYRYEPNPSVKAEYGYRKTKPKPTGIHFDLAYSNEGRGLAVRDFLYLPNDNGSLVLFHKSSRSFYIDGIHVGHLSKTPSLVLLFISRKPEVVCSYTRLHNHLNPEEIVERLLEREKLRYRSLIYRLRKSMSKIRKGLEKTIVTVPGKGVKFSQPESLKNHIESENGVMNGWPDFDELNQ